MKAMGEYFETIQTRLSGIGMANVYNTGFEKDADFRKSRTLAWSSLNYDV